MGANVVTKHRHTADPVPDHLERGDVDLSPSKGPAKSKRPRCCHTIDHDRDSEARWAICGARLGSGNAGSSNIHSTESCKKAGHRRCKECEQVRRQLGGDWG